MLDHLSGTAELHGHVAKKKLLLTPRHRELCLRFAREHSNWTWLDFANVLWTDKSRFTLFHTDGPTFVQRRHGKTLRQDCVVPTVKYGGGGIMIWGKKMSYNGTAFLTKVNEHLNGAGYINILETSAIPSAHLLGFGDNFWIQDDGAPCHRSRHVAEWKAENNLRCLSWPQQSPDLNPIENVWRDVKLGPKQLRPQNLQEPEDNVCNIWNNFPIRKCHSYIRSMPRRVQAVVDAREWYTKY